MSNVPQNLLGSVLNPQRILQNIMANNQFMQNPMAKNAMEMYQQGNISGLQEMAENICKEKGTTPQQVQQMIMRRMGMQ